MKTIEQLLKDNGVNFSDSVGNLKVIRKINKLMRERDESHLWPICGEYNATERAIRWYRRVYFPSNGSCSALEYALGLENLISNYVNKF